MVDLIDFLFMKKTNLLASFPLRFLSSFRLFSSFFPHSDPESFWTQRDSDRPVIQNVRPTNTEVNWGVEPILPYRPQCEAGPVGG